MGRNGGFFFLLAYLIFIVLLGLPVMMLEMSLGRYSGENAVASYRRVHPRAGIVGFLGVLAAFIILSYYSVIGGWILKYFFSYLTTFAAPASFDVFIGSGTEPVVWHFVFMAAAAAHLPAWRQRYRKGRKIMMPALFVLLIIIIVRNLTLPNAVQGLKFMFVPSGSGSFSLSSVSAALGQVFYSLSLCMGITVTYGSYLNKKENIRRSCANVAALDTSVALLAGIAIFPAVFSFGLEVGQGPQLIFETLPRVFAEIPLGRPFCCGFLPSGLFRRCYQRYRAVGGCGLLCDRKLGLEPQKGGAARRRDHLPAGHPQRPVFWSALRHQTGRLYLLRSGGRAHG